MSEVKLGLEDIDDILSDFASLKLAALSHAAAITPLITSRTIGPDCSPCAETEEISTFTPTDENDAHQANSSTKPMGKFVPNLRITIPTQKNRVTSRARKVDVSDCCAISLKDQHVEERLRLKNLKKELEERQAHVREQDEIRLARLNERIEQSESAAAKKVLQNEQELLDLIEDYDRKGKEFVDQWKAKIDKDNQNLAEVSQLLKKKEEEIKRKHAMFDAIRAFQANFRRMTEVFTKTLQGIDKEYSASFSSQKKAVQGLVKSFEQLLHSVNTNREGTQQEVDKASELCKSMEQINAEVIEIMNRIQTEISDRLKKDEEQAQAQKQDPPAPSTEVSTPTAPPPSSGHDTTDTSPSKATAQSNAAAAPPHPLAAFVSQESLAFYTDIKTFYEQHQTAVKALLDDASMKSYRFNCQKVINTPVNAISAVSREHFVDKFNKLDALLSGQQVKAGDMSVSINGHPLGRTYCTMLLAKKFVSQADTMISSNAAAAFPIAAIIVGLWQKYPDFGKFFLAYLYKECPYLVPYFLPQLSNQTQQDYLKSIGYRFSNDGVLENQDQYLKRMSGLARLYGALVVSNPRRGETKPNPHGLEAGWRWLCNILNLCPLPDICATLINEFMQTAGGALWAYYGKQFTKLLKALQDQYLPALNKVDKGGPKARLEGLIAKVTAEGRMDQPEGLLSPEFW